MMRPVAAPRLVVTLPGRTVDALRRELSELPGLADLAEVRLDRLPATERERIAQLFPCPVPLLATLRSRSEGGEGPDGPEERATELARATSLPFSAIDVEPARDAPVRFESDPGSRRMIVRSFHANSTADLVAAVRASATGTSPDDPTYVSKFVGPATLGELFETILPALRGTTGSHRVVHTTGPSGALLRLWGQRFAMPWVYCAPPRTGATVVASPVEPAQLPVDALRRYFSAEEPRGLFAVLGRPIAHSRSPRIHMTWMRAEHRTGLYVALESGDVSEFRRAISPLAEGGFRGLNITRPLKSAAFESATTGNDEDAVRTGCANTLRLRDGRVEAFNTDVAAVRRRFEELVDSRRWDGESLLVLGAGGAARAALVAAQDRGAHATVWARRPREARETARSFGAETDGKAPARSSTLVVNATPAGRVEAGALPFEVRGALEPGSYVLDFVYAPDDPSIRRAAEASGAGYEDGHRLLVYQAAASYGLWWGRPPSDELVTRAVEEEDACAA